MTEPATAAVVFDLASLCTVGTVLTSTYAGVAGRAGVRWTSELADRLRHASIAGAAQLLCGRSAVPPNRWRDIEEALLSDFVALVGDHHLQRQPGVDVLLKQLWTTGVPIAVVSTLPQDMVTLCLEATHLKRAVKAIQCGDRGVPPQASPELHDAALKQLTVEPATSVAIEHTFVGLKSARDAGLFAVSDPTVVHATGGDGRIGAYNEPDLAARLLAEAAVPRLF